MAHRRRRRFPWNRHPHVSGGPAPRVETGQEGRGGIDEGRPVFRRPLEITEHAPRGPIEVHCELTYQACDPFRCRPPATLRLSARGEVMPR
jgi:hypothetical protein